MREIYSWVDWFGELSNKIATNEPSWLAERAHQIPWKEGDEDAPLLRHGDENIDPFSFIYSLAAHHHARRRVYRRVNEAFGLTRELPLELDEAFIFPTPPLVAALFHNRGAGNTNLLWKLFRSAVESIESVSGADFVAAQEISGVAIRKLTQALFLINAREFLPYDDWTLALGVVEAKRGGSVSFDDYRNDISKLREAFPGCMPYEINMLAYETGRTDSPLKLDPTRPWQISTNVYNDAVDRWEDFELNNWAYTGGPGKGSWNDYHHGTDDLQYHVHEPTKGDILLVRFAGLGHGIGAIYKNDYVEAMSDDSRLHVLWLHKKASQLDCGPRGSGFSRGDGKIGKAFRAAYPDTFRFLDRFRAGVPDTSEPVNETSHSSARVATSRPLNTIFYGPPGTGKTYTTMARCVEICDGNVPKDQDVRARYEELVEQRRIRFVTFHQSYGYEEFVEGIRPRTKKAGQISYAVKGGILRRMARDARLAQPEARGEQPRTTSSFDELWNRLGCDGPRIVRGKSGNEYELEKAHDKVVLRPRDGGQERSKTKKYIRKLWEMRERLGSPQTATPGKMRELLGRKTTPRHVWIIYNELWKLAHGQESTYLARRTSNRPNFVLVIDEINRANISKVMGELITLLEEDKREGAENEITVTLPYSGKPFTLPANLHILGTMNTADRSIALLDTALRRRFRFEEMSPQPELLNDAAERTKVKLPTVVAAMNKRLEYLVDRDHLIGHAWFWNAKDRADVDDVMRHKVIPLIAEYFYDDWSKVRAVLGGSDDFVTRERLDPPPGLDNDMGEDRYSWTVRERFTEDAYERLVTGRRSDGDE